MASAIDVQSVDDNDPTILYTGSWTVTPMSLTLVYHGSVHSTTQIGDTASFTFAEVQAVEVILVIPACSGSVVGTWDRDGNTGRVVVPCTSEVQTNYPFYPYTVGSSSGASTILLRNDGNVPFQLDRFIVGNVTSNTQLSNPTTSTTSSKTVTTSSISTSAVTSTRTGSSVSSSSQGTSLSTTSVMVTTSASTLEGTTPTSASSSGFLSPQITGTSDNTSSSHSLPLGPIIGGILGVLALILLFIFLLVRRTKKRISSGIEPALAPTLTPFSIPAVPSRYAGSYDKTTPTTPTTPTTTTELFPSSSSTVPTSRSPHTYSTIPQSTINGSPTETSAHLSERKGPFHHASSSALTSGGRVSFVPSYSPNSSRQYLRSGFSNASATRASVLTDVPPSYDSIRSNTPLWMSQNQPIP